MTDQPLDRSDPEAAINRYSQRDLEQRRHWYEPAAEAYARTRPAYPQALIQEVSERAGLRPGSRILELGCGPATATVAFAQAGASMLCLEPNPAFCELARRACLAYPAVEILPTSLEEWPQETDGFDAVLAATSFHWIPQEIGCSASARALRAQGSLILLWNMELQPSSEVHQCLSEVYQRHAPSLDRPDDRQSRLATLQTLGRRVENSGLFGPMVSGHVESELTYTTEQYLNLLSTYSPYLQLEAHSRCALFEGLGDRIERHFGGSLRLSLLSAFQMARKA